MWKKGKTVVFAILSFQSDTYRVDTGQDQAIVTAYNGHYIKQLIFFPPFVSCGVVTVPIS
jgi:hypothetical protein